MRLISAGSLVRAQSGPFFKVPGEPSPAREARALPSPIASERRVSKSKMPDVVQAGRHPARVVSLVCFIVKRAPRNMLLMRPYLGW